MWVTPAAVKGVFAPIKDQVGRCDMLSPLPAWAPRPSPSTKNELEQGRLWGVNLTGGLFCVPQEASA